MIDLLDSLPLLLSYDNLHGELVPLITQLWKQTKCEQILDLQKKPVSLAQQKAGRRREAGVVSAW